MTTHNRFQPGANDRPSLDLIQAPSSTQPLQGPELLVRQYSTVGDLLDGEGYGLTNLEPGSPAFEAVRGYLVLQARDMKLNFEAVWGLSDRLGPEHRLTQMADVLADAVRTADPTLLTSTFGSGFTQVEGGFNTGRLLPAPVVSESIGPPDRKGVFEKGGPGDVGLAWLGPQPRPDLVTRVLQPARSNQDTGWFGWVVAAVALLIVAVVAIYPQFNARDERVELRTVDADLAQGLAEESAINALQQQAIDDLNAEFAGLKVEIAKVDARQDAVGAEVFGQIQALISEINDLSADVASAELTADGLVDLQTNLATKVAELKGQLSVATAQIAQHDLLLAQHTDAIQSLGSRVTALEGQYATQVAGLQTLAADVAAGRVADRALIAQQVATARTAIGQLEAELAGVQTQLDVLPELQNDLAATQGQYQSLTTNVGGLGNRLDQLLAAEAAGTDVAIAVADQQDNLEVVLADGTALALGVDLPAAVWFTPNLFPEPAQSVPGQMFNILENILTPGIRGGSTTSVEAGTVEFRSRILGTRLDIHNPDDPSDDVLVTVLEPPRAVGVPGGITLAENLTPDASSIQEYLERACGTPGVMVQAKTQIEALFGQSASATFEWGDVNYSIQDAVEGLTPEEMRLCALG